MSETKPPAFQFYAADFLTDTMAMDVAPRGAYITLLCYEWINGSIPESSYSLARICGCSRTEMDGYMEILGDKFIENAEQKGTCVNLRLERERQKQSGFREARSRAGRKSGEQRRNKSRTQPPTESNPTSTSTSTKEKNLPTGDSRQDQDLFGDVNNQPGACPYGNIVSLYHEHCPDLPRVKILSEKRKRALKARWREDKKRQDLKWWVKYFEYIATVSFLNGKNDKGWFANFDFVIRESGMINIIEGKYEGTSGT